METGCFNTHKISSLLLFLPFFFNGRAFPRESNAVKININLWTAF